MRILHLITRLILGGAQENTVLSCLGLARLGHEVTLAYGPIYGPEGSLYEQVRDSDVKLVELSAMVRPIHPIKDVWAYHQCRRLIRRLKPHVVHTHSSKAGIIARHAAWAVDTPLIVHTIHGLPFHPYQNPLVRQLYVRAERNASRRCHRIVCVADAMTRQALAAGVGRPEQYQTIYSGLDVERFLRCDEDRADVRRELNLRQDDYVIGTVARLAELKGHDDLLDGLAPLVWTRGNVKLLWIGDGWWRQRLTRRIDQLGLTGRVIVTGLVPPERISAMMRAMDLLVHPSYREGLARALPQAMLCGVPVVSYDADGAGEVCADHTTGRLVKTGDRQALAEAVAWMMQHPEQCQTMADRAQQLCAERFSADVMVQQLDALYRRDLPDHR